MKTIRAMVVALMMAMTVLPFFATKADAIVYMHRAYPGYYGRRVVVTHPRAVVVRPYHRIYRHPFGHHYGYHHGWYGHRLYR